MSTDLVLLSRVAYRGQEITGPRLRGLLALLAGDLRTGCSAARLVDGLWPDARPEHPAKALQVLVSRTRAQLGAGLIVNTPTGYRLNLNEDQVDSAAVTASAAAAAQHAKAGDHGAALAEAERGLAAWNGKPVAEPDDGPLEALRADRAATYRALARTRALALARLGRQTEAFEQLNDIAREQPRDEEILAELLRCEQASAGPAAALERYDKYRRELRDELGADPGPGLQAVYQQLLRGQAPPIRHGVPHEPNPLLGREADIAAVAQLVRTSRVTSIVGVGGLGKTRLAHAVSRDAEQRVVQVVGLAGVTADDDVTAEVASALGVAGQQKQPDIRIGIVEALGAGPVLLVLDNCEQVIRGVANLVQALVSMTKDLRVLTTSRAPLGLSSESVYQLPELDLSTTVELFEQRARAARPGAELEPEVVQRLCRRLDGLPLAVELAAARIRVMSVAEIARRLEDRFALLRGGTRDAPERHRTLEAVVGWSWNLLDPPAQEAMRALSIFPGGFSAEAARHLNADEQLEELVDQSLLKVADTEWGTRFRMLETVREFSIAKRDAAGDTEDRFLAWARDFGMAHHAEVFGEYPRLAMELIQAEQDNLAYALRLAVDRRDGGTVAATSAVLASLWMVEGSFARLAALNDEPTWVLSHYRPDPGLVEVTRSAATFATASTFMLRGVRAGRALLVLRRLPPVPPDTVNRAIAALLSTPDLFGPDSSVLSALCASDEPLLASVANGFASYLHEMNGDLENALKTAQRMVEGFGDREAPWMRIFAHSRLGELCLYAERADEARRHLVTAVTTMETLRLHRNNMVQLKRGIVLTDLLLGDMDDAEHWLAEAAHEPAGETDSSIMLDLGTRAEIRLARGEIDAGLRQWRAVAERLRTKALEPYRIEAPGMDQETLETQAIIVVAHAQHGQLELVEETVDELRQKLARMLTNPIARPPVYMIENPIWGAALLALAMVELSRGDRRGIALGVRMIALAERFRFLRAFQPTMSPVRARAAAERADKAAYADAVSTYAGLGQDELRATALDLLSGRVPLVQPLRPEVPE